MVDPGGRGDKLRIVARILWQLPLTVDKLTLVFDVHDLNYAVSPLMSSLHWADLRGALARLRNLQRVRAVMDDPSSDPWTSKMLRRFSLGVGLDGAVDLTYHTSV